MLFLLQNYAWLGGSPGSDQSFHSFLWVGQLMAIMSKLCSGGHISYSVCHCDKIPNEKELEEGRVCFDSQIEATVHHGGGGMAAGTEGSWLQEAMDERWTSAHLLLFVQSKN